MTVREREVSRPGIVADLSLDGGAGALVLEEEPFDSELFGLRIARITEARAESGEGHRLLLAAAVHRARESGIEQVLRRAPLESLPEIWALEEAGFEMMDVVVAFARRMSGSLPTPTWLDLEIGPSTEDDLRHIVPIMVGQPWGSRYEADPAYTEEQIRALRSRWLWNSHRGRAAVVLVARLGSEPAGYVTCLLDREAREGEIELVGTLPAARGKRVASRLLEHALAWYSEKAVLVMVKTQATNYAAAALYEKAGFTLRSSQITLRLDLRRKSGERA